MGRRFENVDGRKVTLYVHLSSVLFKTFYNFEVHVLFLSFSIFTTLRDPQCVGQSPEIDKTRLH